MTQSVKKDNTNGKRTRERVNFCLKNKTSKMNRMKLTQKDETKEK